MIFHNFADSFVDMYALIAKNTVRQGSRKLRANSMATKKSAPLEACGARIAKAEQDGTMKLGDKPRNALHSPRLFEGSFSQFLFDVMRGPMGGLPSFDPITGRRHNTNQSKVENWQKIKFKLSVLGRLSTQIHKGRAFHGPCSRVAPKVQRRISRAARMARLSTNRRHLQRTLPWQAPPPPARYRLNWPAATAPPQTQPSARRLLPRKTGTDAS
jgi:hypothetical protein